MVDVQITSRRAQTSSKIPTPTAPVRNMSKTPAVAEGWTTNGKDNAQGYKGRGSLPAPRLAGDLLQSTTTSQTASEDKTRKFSSKACFVPKTTIPRTEGCEVHGNIGGIRGLFKPYKVGYTAVMITFGCTKKGCFSGQGDDICQIISAMYSTTASQCAPDPPIVLNS